MLRITWDINNANECITARMVFNHFVEQKFVAKHDGRTVRDFDPKFGKLTFELRPTAFRQVMEDAPWDN